MTDEEFKDALEALYAETEQRNAGFGPKYTKRQWAALDNLDDSLRFMLDTLDFPNG